MLVLLGAAAAGVGGVGRCPAWEQEGVGGGQVEAEAEEEGEQDGGARCCGSGARSSCRWWCHGALACLVWCLCLWGEGGSGG